MIYIEISYRQTNNILYSAYLDTYVDIYNCNIILERKKKRGRKEGRKEGRNGSDITLSCF